MNSMIAEGLVELRPGGATSVGGVSRTGTETADDIEEPLRGDVGRQVPAVVVRSKHRLEFEPQVLRRRTWGVDMRQDDDAPGL